ncbi:MAG: hypothetical protein ABFS02_14315, partial [Pseudomonadota bacterium]
MDAANKSVPKSHKSHFVTALLVISLLLPGGSAMAGGASIAPGDLTLRHDIQRLADYGIIKGPVSTWPLAWGPIAADVQNYDRSDELPQDIVDAIARIQARARWETRTGELYYSASASLAEEPARMRSFQNTPRESAELVGAISYTGDRFAVSING